MFKKRNSKSETPPSDPGSGDVPPSNKKILTDLNCSLNSKFKPVVISTFDIFINPVIRYAMYPFSCLFKRSLNELNLYSKCEDKLANQLEVTGVLNKVNQSYSMLKYLLSKDER